MNPAKADALSAFGVEMTFADAQGDELVTTDGRRYLDLLCGFGAATLGHRPQGPVRAIRRLLARGEPFNVAVGLPRLAARLAEELIELAGGPLGKVYFGTSGAEAIESAVKFSRIATGRPALVSFQGGYHGLTNEALSLAGHPWWSSTMPRRRRKSTVLPFADLDALEARLKQGDVAAVVVEIVQGIGGARTWPPGALGQLTRLCREHGTLVIIDEVLTGCGRTGMWFGFQGEAGCSPDLVVLSKGITAGIVPISAVMMSDAVYGAVFAENPTIHSNTFEAHAVGAAAALAVITEIKRGRLLEKVRDDSAYLFERLVSLREAGLLSDVRGRGFIIGIGIPAPGGCDVWEGAARCWAQLLERGVITTVAAHAPSYLKLTPSFLLGRDRLEQFVDTLTGVLTVAVDRSSCEMAAA